MKLTLPLIAAGLALAAFTPPASARPADAGDGTIQLVKHDKNPHRGGPPGWSKGNKKGWNGKPMPPGLWKKYQQQRRDRNDHNRWDRNHRYDHNRRDRYDRNRYDHNRRTSNRWDGRRYRS